MTDKTFNAACNSAKISTDSTVHNFYADNCACSVDNDGNVALFYNDDGAPVITATTKTDETALIEEIIEVGKIFLVAADDPYDFNFCDDARRLFQDKCYKLKCEYYPAVFDYYKFKATMDGIKDALKKAPNGKYWQEIFFEDKDDE